MYKKELIKLSRAGVRYMVIGGVALGLSGYPRATLDLDLFVDFSEENLDKFLQVVNRMGYKPRVPVDLSLLKDPMERKRWAEEKGAKVFSFYQAKRPHLQIDVLINSPVSFIEAWKKSRIVVIGGEEIHVACPEDLLLLKQVASREKDREDIKVLKKIIQLEKCKRTKS
jgi:hypothetical protein